MKMYRTFLGIFICLCILLNITGCVSRVKYTVFEDDDHCITAVAGTKRDQIGVILDDVILVICDYKGEELCRKTFDKKIQRVEVYEGSVLLQFGGNTIEAYSIRDNVFEKTVSHSFSMEIRKAELFDWIDERQGVLVLLSNGELWRSKSSDDVDSFVLIDEQVKTEVFLADCLTYLKEDGTFKRWMLGTYYSMSPNIDLEICLDIKDIQVARFDGMHTVLGIGEKQSYLINIIGNMSLEKMIDNSDIGLIYSKKCIYEATLYAEDGEWFYEGVASDYDTLRIGNKRARIEVNPDDSVFVVVGGVIIYNDHEARIQLIEKG